MHPQQDFVAKRGDHQQKDECHIAMINGELGGGVREGAALSRLFTAGRDGRFQLVQNRVWSA